MGILGVILSSWSDETEKHPQTVRLVQKMLGILRAADDSQGLKPWPVRFDQEERLGEDSPALLPSGASRAPVRPRRASGWRPFVSPALSSPQPLRQRRPLRGSWESGSPAGWRSAFPELPASGSSRSLRKNSPCSQASRRARPPLRSWKACCGLLS